MKIIRANLTNKNLKKRMISRYFLWYFSIFGVDIERLKIVTLKSQVRKSSEMRVAMTIPRFFIHPKKIKIKEIVKLRRLRDQDDFFSWMNEWCIWRSEREKNHDNTRLTTLSIVVVVVGSHRLHWFQVVDGNAKEENKKDDKIKTTRLKKYYWLSHHQFQF